MAERPSEKQIAASLDACYKEGMAAESGSGSLWHFVRHIRDSDLGRFVLYVMLITFGAQICAPYFSVRMLRELHFDYLSYTAVHLAGVVASVLAFPMWGRRADALGAARILKLNAIFIPVVPLLWMVARHPAELIVVEMLSGFLTSGFTLCVTNYLFDAVPAGDRMRMLAYYNLLNGGAAFLGLARRAAGRAHPAVPGQRAGRPFLRVGDVPIGGERLLPPRLSGDAGPRAGARAGGAGRGSPAARHARPGGRPPRAEARCAE